MSDFKIDKEAIEKAFDDQKEFFDVLLDQAKSYAESSLITTNTIVPMLTGFNRNGFAHTSEMASYGPGFRKYLMFMENIFKKENCEIVNMISGVYLEVLKTEEDEHEFDLFMKNGGDPAFWPNKQKAVCIETSSSEYFYCRVYDIIEDDKGKYLELVLNSKETTEFSDITKVNPDLLHRTPVLLPSWKEPVKD